MLNGYLKGVLRICGRGKRNQSVGTQSPFQGWSSVGTEVRAGSQTVLWIFFEGQANFYLFHLLLLIYNVYSSGSFLSFV